VLADAGLFCYLWGWVHLFGDSEVAVRASNLPWFFIGFLSIAHFLRRRPSLRNTALLIFCVHPFVVYYLNEARFLLHGPFRRAAGHGRALCRHGPAG